MPSTNLQPDAVLVNIGSHSLAVYPHGPDPTSSDDPVLLFVSGVASSRHNWAAVLRLLPPSLRSYTYDRSGFGQSEPSPLDPTSENIALELSRLVEKAPIPNPLILVGHSWAGILLKEFIALNLARERSIPMAGLVLVDANHETMLEVLDPNDADLGVISEGIDPYAGRGITAEHKFTPQEWDALLREEATEKFQSQAQKEDKAYVPSFMALQRKHLQLENNPPLLGDKPVAVIGGLRSRDWGRLYAAGVEKGNGSEEQREHVRTLIATADEKSAGVMREHLKLSSTGMLVFARESGHFVQMTEPEMVVDAVRWVMDHLRTSPQDGYESTKSDGGISNV